MKHEGMGGGNKERVQEEEEGRKEVSLRNKDEMEEKK